ncbi:MAG: Photosystem II protein Y [Chroococcopsis gigantea SAG 12.99]|jgi:photosystem II PsbY protein|nr:photosystem II protein Y [Chlorogloea purpurea SAG 13.99]MDV2998513.1 Photosystem II protein Y [Chroococcopsis gigantea SAG 12.99]
MDWRVVVVLLPLVIAASWALFNIGAAAIRQFQQFLSKQS